MNIHQEPSVLKASEQASAAASLKPLMSERRVALCGGLLAAIGAMSLALYTPAMPQIVEAFGTTEAMVKMTLSVYFAGFCVAQLICGPLSDGYGRRPVTLAFMGIYLLASVLAMVSSNIETLLVARFLQGVGAAVGVTVSRAIVRDLFTNDASARVMNMIGIVISIGPALSPTLGGITMELFGWHAIFAIMVLMGFIVILVAIFAIRETVVADPSRIRLRELFRSYGKLLVSRYFMYPSLAVAGTTGALYTAATVLPFILMQRVGMSATAYGLGMLLQTASFLSGGLLFRAVMKRISPTRLSMIGFATVLFGSISMAVVLTLYEPTYLNVMLPMCFYAFGIALIMPQMTSAGMARFPHIAGSASAMMGFFQMGGGLVGGSIAATISDPVLAMAIVIPMMGLMAAVVFVLWLRLPKETQVSQIAQIKKKG